VALFNYATRELSAKIVYYGPGLSGKTTNIEMIHKMLRPDQKGRLISLPTETDRTLFFDFLPIDLGQIKGFKVRYHLYTVPGQVFYNATRRLVLQGVDGVVFVADSQRDMTGSNMESLKNLIDNLSSYGKKLEELPFVLQYNKRDLKNVMTMQEMDAELNYMNVPTYEAVAPAGKGVTETLVGISRLVFSHLRKTLLMPGEVDSQEVIEKSLEDKIPKGPEKQQKQQKQEPEPEPKPEPKSKPKLEPKPEPEQLEEISEIEDIKEAEIEDHEIDFEPANLQAVKVELPPKSKPAPAPPVHKLAPQPAQEAASAAFELEELGDIEVEVESPSAFKEPGRPLGVTPSVSVETEGGGLKFMQFESPFVAPDGRAVIPALFRDSLGNPVWIRISITMDKELS